MDTYLGFDPGGQKNFGWAVLSGARFPLHLVARGTADHARAAFEAALKCVGTGVKAVGIDAPLFWNPAGDRTSDKVVRSAIVRLGSSGGTVNSVNSLRGACLIQGMMLGILCQQRISREVALTEAHPKALLWLLAKASRGLRPEQIRLSDLSAYVSESDPSETNEHERDAVLGAIAAFAMTAKLPGWENLYLRELSPMTPLDPQPGYWMPGCTG